jgi:hypothetical protein
MNRLRRFGCLCALTLASSCASSRPEVWVDLPVASRYMFRGVVVDDDAVIQPSVGVSQELSRGALGVSLWTNFELNDDRGLENRFVEVDTTLDYSVSLGRFDVSLGGARYEYPRTGSSGSTELYVLAALNELYVTPTLEFWYDVDEADGGYVNMNLSRQFELGGGWGLFAVAGLGWMDSGQAEYNYGVPSSALSDVQAQIVATYPLTQNVSINVIVVWSSVVDDAYREAVDDTENLVGGTGFAMAF